MKLQPTHIGKLGDRLTRRTFEDSEDDTVLRVIITLDVRDDEPAPETPHPRPSHETRVEARQRLIDARARSRQAAIGPVIDALIEKRLDVKGPKAPRLIRSVVVDGAARDILKGIELPGVARVQIDRSLPLIRPKSRASLQVQTED